MKRIGTYRYVAHDRVRWYLARGWQAFSLGHYHSQFCVGMFKPAERVTAAVRGRDG